MTEDLTGKRVAFLATDGVEEAELAVPLKALREAGATVELLSPDGSDVQGYRHLDKATPFPADGAIGDASPDEFDALVLPGGVANADALRMVAPAVDFVRSFAAAGKPMGVICHAPWLLVEADVVRGRTVTSWPSLKTDLENAGATWVDEEVHTEDGLVTSRKPDDLPAFCAKVIEEIAEGQHMARSA
jgi:protease I